MRQMFVDGAWVDALDGRTFETFDPAYLESKQIYVNLA